MKKIYQFAIAISFILGSISCSEDSLDIEQIGVTTTDSYATANDAQVTQYIAAIYAFILGDGYQAVLAGGPARYRASTTRCRE